MTANSLTEIQRLLSRAIEKETASEWDDAFKLYVQCTQEANHLSRTLSSPSSRTLAKQIAEKALERAKKVKANKTNLKPIATDEYADYNQSFVLDSSAFINGVRYHPWTGLSPSAETPISQPSLSPLQQEIGVRFQSISLPQELSFEMSPRKLCQNSVNDCSLIASLASCLNHRQKFRGLGLLEDTIAGYPNLSTNGVYSVKLFVNGAARQVFVDDTLPLDQDGIPISAHFKSEQEGQYNILPSLIEKAYMQLQGSYDFPGSNSGRDLHALVGWIPETIFIRGGDFVREATWETLIREFHLGNILVTIGTGKEIGSPPLESAARVNRLNLLAAHCYSVLEIEEENDERRITILDPWQAEDSDVERTHMRSWEDVCNTFDTIYISWNPGSWPYSLAIHRTWKPKSTGSSSSFNHHIPFKMDSPRAQEVTVWILLTRHIGKKYPPDNPNKFIALHSMEYSSSVISGRPPEFFGGKGTYTDDYQYLLKLQPRSETFTVIASLEDESGEGANYTLTVYSNTPLSLDRRKEAYVHQKHVTHTFTSFNAGCNFSSSYFMNNPQWRIDIHPEPAIQKASIRIIAEGEKAEAYNASLVWSNQGERVAEISKGDIVASTGSYSYGIASCASDVKPGTYTLVASTFNTKKSGSLALTIDCTHAFYIKSIPQEGADMLKKTMKGSWIANQNAGGNIKFGRYGCNPQVNLFAPIATSVMVRLRTAIRTPKNVTIFHSTEPKVLGREVATSGPYDDGISGVATKKVTLPPGSYIIVPSTHLPDTEGEWEIVVYYERRETQIS